MWLRIVLVVLAVMAALLIYAACCVDGDIDRQSEAHPPKSEKGRFVIAALRVTANAFESTIDDKGKELARTVYEKTDGVVINAAELMKQVREDGNDDREKAD